MNYIGSFFKSYINGAAYMGTLLFEDNPVVRTTDALIRSTCGTYGNFIAQLSQTAWPGPAGGFGHIVIGAPVVEEALFRGVLQELLLKRGPIKVLNALGKDGEGIINSPTAKVARVALISAAFALAHANNSAPTFTAAATFSVGMMVGHLQEEYDGMYGFGAALAYHVLHNLTAFLNQKAVGSLVQVLADQPT